ncbi:MAG: NADPH-dependent FMN reductase [Candidatus Dojkabacteria bacterium]
MDTNLFFPVLLGTTREGRLSESAAKLVAKVGAGMDGIETQLVDPRNFSLPDDGHNDGDQDPEYEKITERADGFFIVSPEYNHSFPPSLKRMLDSENDFSHYQNKPVAFAGVSNGPWGGVRMIESLLSAVRTMGMYALDRDVQFPMVQEKFNENGKLLDEKMTGRIEKVYERLIWKAKALKWGRENL